MEHITLADIALSGACCKSKCSLLFKKYLRDTPINYTTKLWLRNSLSALLGSNSSIASIAYEYGFNGASYYCETFRKYYGMPPMIYKQNQQFPTERVSLISPMKQTVLNHVVYIIQIPWRCPVKKRLDLASKKFRSFNREDFEFFQYAACLDLPVRQRENMYPHGIIYLDLNVIADSRSIHICKNHTVQGMARL